MQDVVILEIFCGTAGVSAALRSLGMENCIALDKFLPKHPLSSITKLDLSIEANQQLVLSWLHHPKVLGAFLAPPRVTARRARDIALEGEEVPQPLRSVEEPDGIAGLTAHDLIKIEQSNILFEFTARVTALCFSLGKVCVVEHPLNSLFWQTTFWKDMATDVPLHYAAHQACAYGAKRPTWTCLASTHQHIMAISLVCDGKHQHEPYNTRQVFAYPLKLCQEIALFFSRCLSSMDIFFDPVDLTKCSTAAAKAASNTQPNKPVLPPLIPEFKNKLIILLDSNMQVVWPLHCVLPPSTKFLQKSHVGENGLENLTVTQQKDWQVRVSNACKALLKKPAIEPGKVPLSVSWVQICAIPWEPEEFLHEALKIKHPLSSDAVLPDILREVIEEQASKPQYEIQEKRNRFLSRWIARAKELTKEEKSFKDSLETHVAEAVKNKRLLLFKELLVETGFPDQGVIDELTLGVNLVGDVPVTGMLPFKYKPALITEEALSEHAAFVRPSVVHSCCSSGDHRIDLEVWDKTLDEVRSGWLEGPLEAEAVPSDSCISRRFGLPQKHKIRLIDDYSASSVNDSVSVEETPVLHTVDVACAMITHWLVICNQLGSSCKSVARAYDLSHAYRQVPLSLVGRKHAFISVFNPHTRKNSFFQSTVLPFGAVKSVHSFLRLARAIWWIGVKGCRIMWSSFFDDFFVLSPEGLEDNTSGTVETFLHLLGWNFAEEGRKCVPFSNVCETLGVSFCFNRVAEGIVMVGNTPNRIDELCHHIKQVCEAGKLSVKSAQKLRGRMQFADAQIYGRLGKQCMRVLSEFASNVKQDLDQHALRSLRLFGRLLKESPPRPLQATSDEVVLIFTDACYEKDKPSWSCGLGGFMCRGNGTCGQFFSFELSPAQRQKLGEGKKKQIIVEAETLAAVAAFIAWSKCCAGKRVFIFLDNEGSKFSIIKDASDNAFVDKCVEILAYEELRNLCILWVARIPSYSNIADNPSRGDIKQMNTLNARDISPEVKIIVDRMLHRL